MKIKFKQIKSIAELKKLAKVEDGLDCYILLNYGVRSSKHIEYDTGDKKPFYVRNEIDDSEQFLTEKQIMNKSYTHIGEAIKKGALIYNL